MKLHTLKSPNAKTRKRVGRGEGSGLGKQSGRGHKGQKAGSGYSRKRGFEGGQMPLQRRIPKFGFKNLNRTEYLGVNIGRIQKAIDEGVLTAEITPKSLIFAGIAGKRSLIKILGQGELTSKVTIKAHAWSSTAAAKIEGVGGSLEKI